MSRRFLPSGRVRSAEDLDGFFGEMCVAALDSEIPDSTANTAMRAAEGWMRNQRLKMAIKAGAGGSDVTEDDDSDDSGDCERLRIIDQLERQLAELKAA